MADAVKSPKPMELIVYKSVSWVQTVNILTNAEDRTRRFKAAIHILTDSYVFDLIVNCLYLFSSLGNNKSKPLKTQLESVNDRVIAGRIICISVTGSGVDVSKKSVIKSFKVVACLDKLDI